MKSRISAKNAWLLTICLTMGTAGWAFPALAQQVQIPTLQVCNQTSVAGKALVKIAGRSDAGHSGTFEVAVELGCTPPGYPTGSITLSNISMSDTLVGGTITSTEIEQVTSTGKHTPTAYISGRCKADVKGGCRFWVLIADNKTADSKEGTPDIVSFLVFDGTGHRVAYGTGPVVKGDIKVASTPN